MSTEVLVATISAAGLIVVALITAIVTRRTAAETAAAAMQAKANEANERAWENRLSLKEEIIKELEKASKKTQEAFDKQAEELQEARTLIQTQSEQIMRLLGTVDRQTDELTVQAQELSRLSDLLEGDQNGDRDG